MSTALYSISQIRDVERAALAELPLGTLMRRAGDATARLAQKLIPDELKKAAVLVLAGPGNNGGDAFEAASVLAGAQVRVAILAFGDNARRSEEAKQALMKARNSTAEWISVADGKEALPVVLSRQWALVIDGLFGIGLKQPISGFMRELVEIVNSLPCPALAIDIPSGLDADTGTIAGDSGIAIRASHTITFIGDKPGLHTRHGRDHAGEVHVDDLGISRALLPEPDMRLNGVPLFAQCLTVRPHESHKGSFGSVAVLGGSHGMTGAPVLSARAALHCGAGLVYVAFPDELPPYDALQTELMFRQAQGFDFSSTVIVAGPGLGGSVTARQALERTLGATSPLVLDADALNLMAEEPAYMRRVARRKSGTLLTPHPLEAARLLKTSSAEVQADRIKAARTLARNSNAVVVLKGSGTVIATPSGDIVINSTGNPALATAGTGDVLAGICGSLLAQKWPAWRAALGAVWLHGAAADELVSQGVGPIGMTAGELIPAVRSCLNRLVRKSASVARRTTSD